MNECFHQNLEWNYKARFALCVDCRGVFADAVYLQVRAAAGRTRWVVRRVVPAPAMPSSD